MSSNQLQLNPSMTESIWHHFTHSSRLPLGSLLVNDVIIPSSTIVCNLGVFIDANLLMPVQVDLIASSSVFRLYNIWAKLDSMSPFRSSSQWWHHWSSADWTTQQRCVWLTSCSTAAFTVCAECCCPPHLQPLPLWQHYGCLHQSLLASLSRVGHLQIVGAGIPHQSQHCTSLPVYICHCYHCMSPFWSPFHFLFSSTGPSLQVFHHWSPLVPGCWHYCFEQSSCWCYIIFSAYILPPIQDSPFSFSYPNQHFLTLCHSSSCFTFNTSSLFIIKPFPKHTGKLICLWQLPTNYLSYDWW